MSDTVIPEPKIVEFGPYRVIGINYIGKNENQEIAAMWGAEDGFIKRMCEIQIPEDAEHVSFGICRCIPRVTDGSFEYIACLPAAANAPIPEGMIEATIGQGTYAVFEVPNLAAITTAWDESQKWLEASSEWEGTCGPDRCECATRPFFELYPSDFTPEGKLYIYASVQKKS